MKLYLVCVLLQCALVHHLCGLTFYHKCVEVNLCFLLQYASY